MKKNKSILIFLLSLLLAGLTSCQTDDETHSPIEELTAADIFVASEKYQSYLKAVRKDAKKMDKILSSLTSEEREEYNRLRHLVPENEEEFNEISQAINVIIGIDYKTRLIKLSELQLKTFKDTNFTPLELLQAQQKYNIHQSTIPRTRSYDEKVQECKSHCDLIAALTNCPSKPIGQIDWECIASIDDTREKCYLLCR